jgi:hypothetical protein
MVRWRAVTPFSSTRGDWVADPADQGSAILDRASHVEDAIPLLPTSLFDMNGLFDN